MSDNLFTDEILAEFRDLYKYYSDNYKSIAEQKQLQDQQELMILDKSGCNQDRIEYLRGGLYPLNRERLSKMLNDNFYDSKLQALMSCIIQSITTNNEVRDWFAELHRIGSESAYGTAYVSGIRKTPDGFGDGTVHQHYKNMFVLKTVQNPKNNLIHEAFVGLMGTNKLRAEIPNFSYVYAYFQCAPVFDTDLWCNTQKNSVSYVVYENVYPSVSFRDYIGDSKNTPDSIINKYLQIVYSLSIAEREIGFTHNDLHTENVLIRKIDKPVYLAYDTDYLLSDGIATMIDYGFSTIRYQGPNYGPVDRYVDHNSPKSISDAYKLLMFILFDSQDIRPDVFVKMIGLYRFFNPTGDIGYAFDLEFDQVRFALPPSYDKTINQYLDFVKRYYARLITDNPALDRVPVLDCDQFECRSTEQLNRSLRLDRITTAKSSYEFMRQLEDYQQQEDRDYLINNFNYRLAIQQDSADIAKIDKSSQNIITELLTLNRQLKQTRFFTDQNLALYRQYITAASDLYEVYRTQSNLIKGMRYVVGVYRLTYVVDDSSNIGIKSILSQIVYSVAKNYQSIVSSGIRDKKYNWYYTDIPKFLANIDLS